MKTQLKVSIVVFAAVFFAATLFAMLYVGGVAEAFRKKNLTNATDFSLRRWAKPSIKTEKPAVLPQTRG